MKGKIVHNLVMVAVVAAAFRRASWATATEVAVRWGGKVGFVDLVAESDGYCIAVEAECSARRIQRDLEKAAAIMANELWIVVPNPRVRAAVNRFLVRANIRVAKAAIFVLTPGAAVQQVSRFVCC